MCGIVGIRGTPPVAHDIYKALSVLQHRGQDAAGIAVADGRKFNLRKRDGLVREVFKQRHMDRLQGNLGIGHVRYPTAGSTTAIEAQPFYVNSPYGISLVHNGTITNAEYLRERLWARDMRHLNTDSDSEVLLNVLAHCISKHGGHIAAGMEELFEVVEGAYSCVAMIMGKGLLAFRDPYGIRPLAVGQRDNDIMVASESTALDALGYEMFRNVPAGGYVMANLDGTFTSNRYYDNKPRPCIFEYVYLARPDAMIDGISVYKARLRMGEKLGDRINALAPNHSSDIDVVIPIPETSRTIAITTAARIKRPLREGFVKNRYIGRTFIMPEQSQRENGVREKLNPIDLEFRGKNVLLVDDSIVRGTTSREIVQMVRDCGAGKVYLASASPPIRYPNVYGIDMPSSSEFIADGRTEEQIRNEIGCDQLIYQTLDDLVDAVRHESADIEEFETSVFDGNYIAGDITPEYLAALDAERCNATRS